MLGRFTNVAALQADADVAAWVAAVIAVGGSVSATQQACVTTLVQALKGCGAWALTDDYALYAVENQTQALVTLKMRITQTLAHLTSSNPTFVANRGFLGNQDGFIDTGWNASNGFQYVQNSARFGFWVYTDPGAASTLREMGNDETNASSILFGSGGNIAAGINSASAIGWTPSARSGLIVVDRTGVSASAAYQNGTSQTAGTPTSIAVANRNFFVLSANSVGGALAPTNSGVSCALVGAPLSSSSMHGAEYSALRAYMTSVGVP